jgi:hypothetical protein
MKTRTGVIILIAGLLCLAGAVGAIAVGVMGFVDKLRAVATVATPGGTEFLIEAPGTYTLWHDHTTTHSGSSHRNPAKLPPDFTFTLTNLQDGRPAAFTALGTSMTQTMNTTDRESVGLGTFQVTGPGLYKLEASNPAGDHRILSLTEGTIISSIGGFGASFGVAALLGLLGVGALVAGFIGILAGRKNQAPAPPPPPVQ